MDKKLQTLLLSHYESESWKLTSAAEANLLKYKESGKHDPPQKNNDGQTSK
jgi:hypothetical protein